MTDVVLNQREGAVAKITLNRPDKMNAFTVDMWTRLAEAFRSISADETVRCVVLEGAGGRAFAAGADIGEFGQHRHDALSATQYGRLISEAITSVRDCPHPIVTSISGACIGAGLEIAAVTDIRLCTAGSKFGAPVRNLGLTMSHAELHGLVSLIGRARTLELLLEGKIYSAADAKDMGLVNRVLATPDDLQSEVKATTERILDGAPLVARWHKRFIRQIAEASTLSPADYDEAFECFDTADFTEGVAAFLEKRKPVFRGL
jgi:enoyl-CoA hydratase